MFLCMLRSRPSVVGPRWLPGGEVTMRVVVERLWMMIWM